MTSAELGIEGGDGMVAGVSTAMSVNGYRPGLATAARLISIPVGPLEGRLAQPARAAQTDNIARTLRNEPPRCGTRDINID